MRTTWKKLCLALLMTLLFVGGVPSVSQNFGVIRTEAAGTVGLSKTKLTAIAGKKYKIVLRNRKRDTKIQWSSSKKSIATVSGSGTTCEITAKKAGTTVVTAKVDGKTYCCTVTVKKAAAPAKPTTPKAKALKAYEAFLKNGTIMVEDEDGNNRRRKVSQSCTFALIYLDDDNVPELLLDYSRMPDCVPWQVGYLYTYRNGKVTNLGVIHKYDSLWYYKKTGVLVNGSTQDGAPINVTSYSRLHNGKYQDNLSKASIAQYIKNAAKTKITFVRNTEANRKKYLK